MNTETQRPTLLAAARGSAAVERKKRQWWAVADGDVREVTGYSCAPSNPDMWWCPEVGFSGSEGHHLFETQDAAFAKAIAESERDLTALQKRLEGLKRRRQNIALGIRFVALICLLCGGLSVMLYGLWWTWPRTAGLWIGIPAWVWAVCWLIKEDGKELYRKAQADKGDASRRASVPEETRPALAPAEADALVSKHLLNAPHAEKRQNSADESDAQCNEVEFPVHGVTLMPNDHKLRHSEERRV